MKRKTIYCSLLALLVAACLPCEAENMAIVVDKANVTANVAGADLAKILDDLVIG